MTKYVFSSMDDEIHAVKPNPNGILYILQKFGIEKSTCLVIGDRDDRDGEAARRAGVDYLILPNEMHDRKLVVREFIHTYQKKL